MQLDAVVLYSVSLPGTGLSCQLFKLWEEGESHPILEVGARREEGKGWTREDWGTIKDWSFDQMGESKRRDKRGWPRRRGEGSWQGEGREKQMMKTEEGDWGEWQEPLTPDRTPRGIKLMDVEPTPGRLEECGPTNTTLSNNLVGPRPPEIKSYLVRHKIPLGRGQMNLLGLGNPVSKSCTRTSMATPRPRFVPLPLMLRFQWCVYLMVCLLAAHSVPVL